GGFFRCGAAAGAILLRPSPVAGAHFPAGGRDDLHSSWIAFPMGTVSRPSRGRVLVPDEGRMLPVPVHLGPLDPAALPLRYAHGVRLEAFGADQHCKPADHRL